VRDTLALALGYVVAVVIIMQWPLVVRQRRRALMVLHTLAMIAVIAAWLHKGYPLPAAVSGLWVVVSLAWYARGHR
jgi:hypothetical protein